MSIEKAILFRSDLPARETRKRARKAWRREGCPCSFKYRVTEDPKTGNITGQRIWDKDAVREFLADMDDPERKTMRVRIEEIRRRREEMKDR